MNGRRNPNPHNADTAPGQAGGVGIQGERRIEQASRDLLRRIPPHSVEAEQAVLAGILINPPIMHSIADMLQREDFYLPAHQALFDVFLDLYGKSVPIDLVTVTEQLKARSLLEQAGGAVFLAELSEAVVSGTNAAHYATLVRDKSLQRKLIAVCADIIGSCYNAAQDVSELLDKSEQDIFSVSQRITGASFKSAKEMTDKLFERLTTLSANHDVITGVPTGYSRLNGLTAGLQPSDLIIVAARPSMGKTAFAVNMAMNAAVNADIPVCIYSLEMSVEQLMMRMLAAQARVDAVRLRRPNMLTDEDWKKLQVAADTLSRAPIYIDDSPALSTLEMRARTRRIRAEKNIGLVVVDYLQLMRTNRRTDSRELEISDISRSLKALAKELNIPVVALSQLNRKVEERGDKRPMLSDLRESGAIEQDADVIMFIYRDDVYKHQKPADRPPVGEAEIIIGKQRNGPVGAVDLLFHSPYTIFVEKDASQG